MSENENTVQTLYEQVVRLSRQMESMELSSSAKKATVKIADPDPFHGDRSKSQSFLLQLHLKFKGEAHRFSCDETKIIYANALLRGLAFRWISPFLTQQEGGKQPAILLSYSAWRDAFLAQFGDTTRIQHCEAQILSMRQGKRRVSELFSDFMMCASELGWPDSMLFRPFYNSLSEDIKDVLILEDRPASFQDYVAKAITIDNRLEERKQQKQRRAVPAFMPPVDPPPSSRQDPPVPMELDSFRLTPQERQRRLAHRLCFYCGQAGHRKNSCPTLSSSATLNSINVVSENDNAQ
jgi:hypothetical protein